MERQFPKNVRQIGNVSDQPRIYMEDYVNTYLNQLKESATDHAVGVLLVGEGAFAGCARLRELRLPSGLGAIGESAFRGCPELTLRAPAGSFAESWARAHSMKFEPLNLGKD